MGLNHYSSDQFEPGINAGMPTKHVPFRAYVGVVPVTDGRRGTHLRDLAKIAGLVESDLELSGFNIATPVAYTVQFGQSPARLSIVGFIDVSRTRTPNEPPTTFPRLIHSGTVPGEPTAVTSGPSGGSTSWGQEPILKIDQEVAWLKNALESSSDYIAEVFFIEYNGVKYGAEFKRRFRTWPNT